MLRMSPYEPPNKFHLLEALGWSELNCPQEAAQELAKISPELAKHPVVLEARWQVAASAQAWEQALQCAEALVEVAPDNASGWLHRAYASRRVAGGGLQKAWDALRPAFDRFPSVMLIAYNLACYAAQMGRTEEAWDWYEKAEAVAEDVARVSEMALDDADLAPLWTRIRDKHN